MREIGDYQPHEIMGVHPEADAHTIMKMYKQQALKRHPDKNQELAEMACEDFQKLSAAYRTMMEERGYAVGGQTDEQIDEGAAKNKERWPLVPILLLDKDKPKPTKREKQLTRKELKRRKQLDRSDYKEAHSDEGSYIDNKLLPKTSMTGVIQLNKTLHDY